MNKLLLIMCILPVSVLAGEVPAKLSEGTAVSSTEPGNTEPGSTVKTVNSPQNRVAVLELYTSEGCSSCPPADRFLSKLKDSGISDRQLIPMAFHVTYWDYIGWNDRFAKKQFDQRQRDLAYKNKSSTVYTPQFLLAGDDYRRYANFSDDVNKLVKQKSSIQLKLSAQVEKNVAMNEVLHLTVNTNISEAHQSRTSIYFVVLENNLSSDVSEGENEGEELHHDYVVRQMFGPYIQNKTDIKQQFKQQVPLNSEWKKQDLSIVVFAENPGTGEVLQAVRLGQI